MSLREPNNGDSKTRSRAQCLDKCVMQPAFSGRITTKSVANQEVIQPLRIERIARPLKMEFDANIKRCI
jgi:hypothetical protein